MCGIYVLIIVHYYIITNVSRLWIFGCMDIYMDVSIYTVYYSYMSQCHVALSLSPTSTATSYVCSRAYKWSAVNQKFLDNYRACKYNLHLYMIIHSKQYLMSYKEKKTQSSATTRLISVFQNTMHLYRSFSEFFVHFFL